MNTKVEPKVFHITEAKVVCILCGSTCKAGDGIPDVDGNGSIGCPVEDCGGILVTFGR